MNISIIGPGAMGLLFGGYLSKKHNVTLIGRNSEKINKINENGVVIRENDGTENTYYPSAVSDAADIEPAELVILFVKSGSSEEALNKCKNIIGKDTFLMTLQNGAGHEELLSHYAEHVLIGTTQQGSYCLDDNAVCHSGGGDTAFGVINGNCTAYKYIADAFAECGFPCTVTENINYMIWHKLMINGSSSVLSGLLQVNQGYIVENDAAWSIAKKLITEMCNTANADGCAFDADEQIERIYNHLKNAPGGYTSVYADIKAGRKTEVRRISGAVVEKANKYGVLVPTNETVLNLIIALENK